MSNKTRKRMVTAVAVLGLIGLLATIVLPYAATGGY